MEETKAESNCSEENKVKLNESSSFRFSEHSILRILLRLIVKILVASLVLGAAMVLWLLYSTPSELTGIIHEGSLEVNSMYLPTLKFRQNCRNNGNSSEFFACACFKILQIADIHLGEAENLDWGPEQDRKTWFVLDSVILQEEPDLIILSGDQLTGNNCKENATAYYQMLGEFLSKYNTPWATIFGNHDDLGFVDPDTGKESPVPKYGRKDLLAIDQSFPLSLSRSGPDNIFGTSNYVLDIYAASFPSSGSISAVAAQILLLDSGGGFLPEVIDESQLKWLKDQEQDNTNIPAVAFQHIPTLSHAYSKVECMGMDGDNGMAPLESDAGIVQALVESQRFLFLAVGHNHGNDYCCPYHSNGNETMLDATPRERAFHLCFGRHSGYGGYGKWERGARVYELKKPHLQEGELEENTIQWKSWVRLESGEIIDQV